MHLISARRDSLPDLDSLPLERPLDQWFDGMITAQSNGGHLRVAWQADRDLMIRELPAGHAALSFRTLTKMAELGLPVAKPLALVYNRRCQGRALDDLLLVEVPTNARAAFRQPLEQPVSGEACRALAGTMVRLHIHGFRWQGTPLHKALLVTRDSESHAILTDLDGGAFATGPDEVGRIQDVDRAKRSLIAGLTGKGGNLSQVCLAQELVQDVLLHYRRLWQALYPQADSAGQDDDCLDPVCVTQLREPDGEDTPDPWSLKVQTRMCEPISAAEKLWIVTGLELEGSVASQAWQDFARFRALGEYWGKHAETLAGLTRRWLNQFTMPAEKAVVSLRQAALAAIEA